MWRKADTPNLFNDGKTKVHGYYYDGQLPEGVTVKIEPVTASRFTVVMKGNVGSLYPLKGNGTPQARTFKLAEAFVEGEKVVNNRAWIARVTGTELLTDDISW